MRTGLLCGLLLLAARPAQAQTWPAYQGYPMPYPAPGFVPGAWPMPQPVYAPFAPVAYAPGSPGTPVAYTPGAPGTPVAYTPGAPGTPVAYTPGAPGTPVTYTPGAPGTPVAYTPGAPRPGFLPDPNVIPTQAPPPGRPVSLRDPNVKPAQAPAAGEPVETTIAPEAGAVPLDLPGSEAAAAPVVLPTSTYFRPHQEKWWISGGYTAAWLRPAQISVPILTTGAAADSPPGALGQPGTVVLFGNDSVNYGTFHGGWFQLGFWLDPENHCSLDFDMFFLPQNHVQYSAFSDPTGSPAITRPVYGLTSQSEAAFVDALPGVAAGGSIIDIRALMLGGEANARYYFYCFNRLRADALIGFRTLHFEEGLDIQDRIQPLAANSLSFLGQAANPPNVLTDLDHFKALNTFYGANFGGRLRWEHDWGFIDVFGKLGVGVNSQIMNIYGVSNLITPSGAAAAAPGGILALPTNIGEHSRSQVGYVREVGFNLGCDPHPHIRFKVGYSFLAWSGVVRAGDALDRVVNPHQVPTDQAYGQLGGGTRPAFVFADELLWVQFLNVGMEFHW